MIQDLHPTHTFGKQWLGYAVQPAIFCQPLTLRERVRAWIRWVML